MSRSSATSLMVRNASGALSKRCSCFNRTLNAELDALLFSPGGVAGAVAVDPLLQDRGRLEHHDPARRDRHLGPRLRIAADTLALLAHHEGAERRQFHRLALFQA